MTTITIVEHADPYVLARFWSKVSVGRPRACWEWRRARNELGYGVFKPSAGHRPVKAHRFAWATVNGAIPEGAVVRHDCDNPPCCNPSHLRIGTQADNVADIHARGRRRYQSALGARDIEDAQQRFEGGESQASIARSFGVSASYMSMLISGRRKPANLKEQ